MQKSHKVYLEISSTMGVRQIRGYTRGPVLSSKCSIYASFVFHPILSSWFTQSLARLKIYELARALAFILDTLAPTPCNVFRRSSSRQGYSPSSGLNSSLLATFCKNTEALCLVGVTQEETYSR